MSPVDDEKPRKILLFIRVLRNSIAFRCLAGAIETRAAVDRCARDALAVAAGGAAGR
jgi:hypothetical protein